MDDLDRKALDLIANVTSADEPCPKCGERRLLADTYGKLTVIHCVGCGYTVENLDD